MSNAPIETLTTDQLHDLLADALAYGRFGAALAAADEICRAERAGTCRDLIAPAHRWPAMAGYSREQLQGLEDRIEQYNALAGA